MLRVSEVAHDIQQQVSQYVVSLGLANSYVTYICTYAHGFCITYSGTKMWQSIDAQDLTGEGKGQRNHAPGFQSLWRRVYAILHSTYNMLNLFGDPPL